MRISVAYIKSNDQFAVLNFPKSEEMQFFDISELKNCELNAIFVSTFSEEEEIVELLEQSYQYCPVIKASKYFDDVDDFSKLSEEKLNQIFPAIFENWVVQNNLTLIKHIFSVTQHLKDLWENDRTAFAEELWFILRNNLGTRNLSLIFNDVKTTRKDRNLLIRVNISGTRLPSPTTGGEMEAALLKNYEKNFHDQFDIIEYIKDEGKMVATVSVNKSPMLMIAELYNISPLQQNLISALFEGLQST